MCILSIIVLIFLIPLSILHRSHLVLNHKGTIITHPERHSRVHGGCIALVRHIAHKIVVPSTNSPLFLTGAPSKVQSQYSATGNLISKIMYVSELATFFC